MKNQKKDGKEISRQISVYKTGTALLELNNCMRPSSLLTPWHIHAQGREDENGYSLIRAVMVNYTNRENSTSVYANLSPDLVKYLYARMFQNETEFSYHQQKIFQGDGATAGQGIVTIFSICRRAYDANGAERRYPWMVEIQNGKGKIAHNRNGGQFCEKGTYRKEKSVSISLTDEDIFLLFSRAVSVIGAFEQDALYGRKNARNFQKLYQMIEALIVGKTKTLSEDKAA